MQKFEYEKPLIEIYLRPAGEEEVLGDMPGVPSKGAEGPGSGNTEGDWS